MNGKQRNRRKEKKRKTLKRKVEEKDRGVLTTGKP